MHLAVAIHDEQLRYAATQRGRDDLQFLQACLRHGQPGEAFFLHIFLQVRDRIVVAQKDQLEVGMFWFQFLVGLEQCGRKLAARRTPTCATIERDVTGRGVRGQRGGFAAGGVNELALQFIQEATGRALFVREIFAGVNDQVGLGCDSK